MSSRTNSQQDLGDAVIDSVEFSRQARALEGEVAVARLERLADLISENTGVLRCSLRGIPASQGRGGKAGLELAVTGSLRLRCERCLETMDFPLRLASRLQLVAPGESWPDADGEGEDALTGGNEGDGEDWDAIEAGREMSVLALIEDEVLLALPIVPRHEVCRPPVAMEDEHEPSPFAVLAKLKH